MNSTSKIYTLNDPDTLVPKYVGKTNQPLYKRFGAHAHVYSMETKKHKWVKTLLDQGKKPIIQLIDEVPASEGDFWEGHYISLFRSWGFDLTNMNDGGYGASREHYQRLSKMFKGELNPAKRPGVRIKISRTKVGQDNPSKREEVRAVLSIKASQRVHRPIAQLTKQGSLVRFWDRQTDAAKELGINKDSIFSVLKKKTRTAGGFQWLYKNEYERLVESD